MSTFAIICGFALMLFLPCAIALKGTKNEPDEASAYSDRIVEDAMNTRVTRVTEAARIKAAAAAAANSASPELDGWGDLTDPQAPGRATRSNQTRVERAEIEALRARAAAARAHAEALAAIARAAAAKAEAAAADATALESEAAQAILDTRRAA